MQTFRRGFTVLAMLSLLAACGEDDLGVRRVEFDLAPSHTDTLPSDFDRVGALMASGHVEADNTTGRGELTVSGLPLPPLGWEYAATLMFAHGARKALPGGGPEVEGGGHAHGALVTAIDDEHSDDDTLESVMLGVVIVVGGSGDLEFGADEVDGHSLGALRSAMVMLVPSAGGMGGMVLFGEVGQEVESSVDESSGGGGHEHGA